MRPASDEQRQKMPLDNLAGSEGVQTAGVWARQPTASVQVLPLKWLPSLGFRMLSCVVATAPSSSIVSRDSGETSRHLSWRGEGLVPACSSHRKANKAQCHPLHSMTSQINQGRGQA